MARTKTTFRLLAACAACGAALWLLDHRQPRTLSFRDQGRLVTRRLDEIDRVVMTDANGARRVFSRGDEGWRIDAPISSPASESAILSLVDAIEGAPLLAFVDDREIALRELGYGDFGLDEPAGSIEVFGPRTSLKVTLGGREPASTNETFALVDPLAGVCVTDDSLLRLLVRPLEDFADRRLCRANLREVETVEITLRGRQPLRVARTADRRGWRIVSPEATPADWGEMLRFFETLGAARIESFLYSQDAPAGRAADPELVIRLFAGSVSEPRTITVQSPLQGRGDLFVAVNDSGSRVALTGAVVRALSVDGNAVRDRRVFPSGPTLEVAAFSLAPPSGPSVMLGRTANGDWELVSPVRAAADQERASELVGSLLSLRAAGYIPAAALPDATGEGGAPDARPGPVFTMQTATATNHLACTFVPDETGVTNVAVVVDDADFAALLPAGDMADLLSAAAAPSALVGRRLASYAARDLIALEIARPGQPAFRLDAAPDGSWSTAGGGAAASPAAVEECLSALVARKVVSISSPTPGEDPYGLLRPRLECVLEPRDPARPRIALAFGNATSSSDGVYAVVRGSDIVYEMPAEVFHALNSEPEAAFRNPEQ